jgi:hypothetical protein
LLEAIVDQRIYFVGFVKHRVNAQLSTALANVSGGIVTQDHHLLARVSVAAGS